MVSILISCKISIQKVVYEVFIGAEMMQSPELDQA
jgi:hypothetical protein